jgi:hypothetical protein
MHPTFMRAAAAAAKKSEASVLTKGAKKDPELYVRANSSKISALPEHAILPLQSQLLMESVQILGSIMCGAFGLAGFYFGMSPRI